MNTSVILLAAMMQPIAGHAVDHIGNFIDEMTAQEDVLVNRPQPCPVTYNAKGVAMQEDWGNCYMVEGL